MLTAVIAPQSLGADDAGDAAGLVRSGVEDGDLGFCSVVTCSVPMVRLIICMPSSWELDRELLPAENSITGRFH